MDMNGVIPHYCRLKEVLKQQIRDGYLKVGDRILSERFFAEKYSLSRGTVRQAISELVHDGMLCKKQGSGTFVLDLKSQESRVLANSIVFITRYESEFCFGILRGIENVISRNNFHLITKDTNEELVKEIEYIGKYLDIKVDGMIIWPIGFKCDFNIIRRLESSGIPFVFVDRYLEGLKANYVVTDNIQGGYIATSHLIELGHKRIIHVTMKERGMTSQAV